MAAIHGLEGVMVTKMPVIPVVDGAGRGIDSSQQATGWPSPANPYDDAAPVGPSAEVVALHLVPRT